MGVHELPVSGEPAFSPTEISQCYIIAWDPTVSSPADKLGKRARGTWDSEIVSRRNCFLFDDLEMEHALLPSSAEREALRWIQKYIPAFGGDPSRVTLYVLARIYVSARFRVR